MVQQYALFVKQLHQVKACLLCFTVHIHITKYYYNQYSFEDDARFHMIQSDRKRCNGYLQHCHKQNL